jgi:hypothetical protein
MLVEDRAAGETSTRAGSQAPFPSWPDLVVGAADDRGWFASLLGRRCRVLLHGDQTQGRMSQIEVCLTPYERMSPLLHLGTDVLINVLEGAIVLTSDCGEAALCANGFAAISRRTRHHWSAERASRLLLTFSPGGIEQLLRACAPLREADTAMVARTFGTEIGSR